jgi:hypothetical protein
MFPTKEIDVEQLFFESPVLIGVSGLLVVLLALFFWSQTGARSALAVAGGAVLLTTVLVMVCQMVETDRERIRRMIDEVAAALEVNDLERVYSYIHPNATNGLLHARSEISRFHFTEARLTRLKSILVESRRQPATAIAEFNVFVALESQGQKFKVPRFVKVYFAQQDGRWLVRDYEHFEPTVGFQRQD